MVQSRGPITVQHIVLVALFVALLSVWAFYSSERSFKIPSSIVSSTQHITFGKQYCPDGLARWPRSLIDHEKKVYSQTMQDGVLQEIFHNIGMTNRYYVEFGFDANSFDLSIGANTGLLREQGWTGLLMDGGHENSSINLHKEFIYDTNIVELFQKYNVPTEPDYVSIDVDSCDIWILLALTKVYRPRVITIEYNRNFPAGSTFAWPPDCNEQWQVDRVMGSSLGAIFLAARDAGYRVVHVIHETDAFLVREDIAQCLDILPQWAMETRVTGFPLHGPSQNETRNHILIDYAVYRTTHDVDAARKSSIELLPHAPLMIERGMFAG